MLRFSDKGLVCADLCGQLDSHCLSSKSRGNKFSSPKCYSSAHLEVVGDSSGSFDSTVHHGPSQCVSGLVISSESGSRVRMDTQDRGVPRAPEEVASVSRSVWHLTKSPMFTIFFTVPRSERAGYGCSSPELGWVAGVCLSNLVSDSSCYQEAPVVLWGPTDHRTSLLASEALVSGPSRLGGGRSDGSSSVQGPSSSTTLPPSSSGSARVVTSCLKTFQRFARARGFSKYVAQQAALARRPSSRAGYQAKWSVFRQWCHSEGHSVSRPSQSKIVDFLFWLRRFKEIIRFCSSMLSAVFRTILPEISTSPIIMDLSRSFQVEAPCRSVRPPSWDLVKVLDYLRSPVFEPLSSASLRGLTRKTLFLVTLATAKRVGELRALSCIVSFSSSSCGLSYVPEFLAKMETAVRPLPRTFAIQSLGDFAAGLQEDLLLCPVRSLSEYIARTSKFVDRPRRLFVSPRCPSRAMSRNGISYFLREVIVHSGASSEAVAPPKAHSMLGIATSSAFFRNWSLSSVFEAASWCSNTIFTLFYLRDLHVSAMYH